ncbi:MAG: hypothetical protein GWP10_07180 [Nitrospiraceae bacterium]|nr:hypothetical protein [Nitrospiraceae bacterium]
MERIKGIVRKSAMKFGFVVVEMKINKSNIDVTLYNGVHNVNFGDLKNVTRKIQDELASAGFENMYSVSTSSPGLDRVLKTREELGIFSGRLVKVSLLEEGKIITEKGLLQEIDSNSLVIRKKSGNIKISLKKLTSVQLWDKMLEKGGGKK